MEKSFLDESTDIILESIKDVNTEISEMFKGTRPYRQVPIPDAERIMNYMKWAGNPELEPQFRQSLGDAEVDMIHSNMKELINKRLVQ